MGGSGADALEAARAALRAAEQRVGVTRRAEVLPEPVEPVSQPLADLLPGRTFPKGTTSTVVGSTSLLLELLGATQRAGEWVAFVGMPTLGLLAVHEAGVDLERVAYIPNVGPNGPAAVAALLDGIEHIVVGPACALLDTDRRRLLARARERGSALISTTPWSGAALALDVERATWAGPDGGDYWLRETRYDVVRHSKADGPGRRFTIVRTHETGLARGTTARTRLELYAAAEERRSLRLVSGAA
ncbi:hypothetical protein [Puerhibacterium puerhi]|uniref:hypothetical protein n=1 Tax=Puerhibacterium puerhi TaxID=2692623 RepID=UPI001356C38F|nr:hypothetical protein [Puerhibacterium puerhi]